MAHRSFELGVVADLKRWQVWMKPFDIDRLPFLAEGLCET
jgi:hypothetical protein